MATTTHQFTTEDVTYLSHGSEKLLARIYKPEGPGPFPAVVDLHGGAWAQGERTQDVNRDEALAKGGIVAVALDFRQAREGAYPKGIADINYAVRWVKANARELKTRPDLVAISGQSSGGHLAMLVAMRPADPRYAAIALPQGSPAVDASVRCVAMSWPVINPLSRYRHAEVARDGANPPAWPAHTIASHDAFWQTQANMSEGSPLLALERGEKVATPPAVWLQTYNDIMHDYHDPDSRLPGNEPQRFVAAYKKAGGEVELKYFDAPQRFTSVAPTSPASQEAFALLVAFFHRHMPTAG
jgi:acetyl esterase